MHASVLIDPDASDPGSGSSTPSQILLNSTHATFSFAHSLRRVDPVQEVVQAGEDGLDERVTRRRVRPLAVDVRHEEGMCVHGRACERADLGEGDLPRGLEVLFAVDCSET